MPGTEARAVGRVPVFALLSISCWDCHSVPRAGHTEGSLPTRPLALCQRPCHRGGAALLLIVTRRRSQPGLLLPDGGRKLVALPRALGCGEPAQLPRHPGRGQTARRGWRGWVPAAPWAGAVGGGVREPAHQPMLLHGNTSTGAFQNPSCF